MSEGSMGVLLGTDLDVPTQLRWAARLAEARSLDMLVFQYVESRDGVTVEIDLEEGAGDGGSPVACQVRELIAASPKLRPGARDGGGEPATGSGADDDAISVRLKEIRCDGLETLRLQLLGQVRKNKLRLATMAHQELNTSDADLIKERRLFLRYAPCEVVLCYGLDPENRMSSILVGVGSGAHGNAALRLGRDLAVAAGRPFTAVRVNPNIGPDAERVGTRRLESEFQKTLGSAQTDADRRVVIDDQVHAGLRRVWEEDRPDLVVLGASRHGILGGQPSRGKAAKLFKGEPHPAVVIVRAGSPIRSRFRGLVEGAIERWVPQIDRDNRVSLVDRVQSSSSWNFDFSVLMVLSTVIASIGLMQNSAAVVIGAMLVAPLMTPLLGIGLALVQGNPVLARISLRATLLGLAVSLVVAAITGLLTPTFVEPTREMLTRGGPGLLDLAVAFASGLAAAYASSRPNLLAALPGVAIAAALVPPIATSGLALSLGNFHLAAGALLLFVINMITIVLATMVSFWSVGLRNIGKASRWELTAVGVVLLSVVALGVYLSVKPVERPTAAEIRRELVPPIEERLGDEYRLEGVAVAYDELGVQLNLRISGEKLAPEEMAHEIRRLVRRSFADPVRVRLTTEIRPASPPH